jgi:hypothetical protein
LQHSLSDIRYPNHNIVGCYNGRQHNKVNNQESIRAPHGTNAIGNLDRNPIIELGDTLEILFDLFPWMRYVRVFFQRVHENPPGSLVITYFLFFSQI